MSRSLLYLSNFISKRKANVRFVSQKSQYTQSRKNRNLLIKGTLTTSGILIGSSILTSVVHFKKDPIDIEMIKDEIIDVFEKDTHMGPTFIRLAWHSSGTYSKHDKSGGSKKGSIRLKPEINHQANAGLEEAINALEPIKANHPNISYADLYILSGVTMIEEMGGPKIPIKLGRRDGTSDKDCTPDNRLPSADLGTKEKTINGIREVFYRMGFNDQEIVALVGAHAVGRCYPNRSGYKGPWTQSEWTFSNVYFKELLENKWTIKKWNGPEQYEDPTGDLMMLPSDMALLWDPEFRKYVELYSKDEDLWHKDFSKAFKKLIENGVIFENEISGWKKYFKFWPFINN